MELVSPNKLTALTNWKRQVNFKNLFQVFSHRTNTSNSDTHTRWNLQVF